MSQITNINSAADNQPFGAASALNDVDLDDFLNLMIAELQNQDPLTTFVPPVNIGEKW